jgi:hypothetical protein
VPQGLLWRKLGSASRRRQTGAKSAAAAVIAPLHGLLPARFPFFGSIRALHDAEDGIAGRGTDVQYPQNGRSERGAIILSKAASHMTDEKPATGRQHTLRGDEARQDRLKAKLRENLKRRKSQERERGRPSSDGHQDCPDGEVGKTDA